MNNKKKNQRILTESPSWYDDLERRYIDISQRKIAIEKELSDIRDELHSHMKDDNINKIVTQLTEVHVIKSYDGRKVDTKRLKNDHPDIFNEYSTPYTTNEHLQVTINKSNMLNE